MPSHHSMPLLPSRCRRAVHCQCRCTIHCCRCRCIAVGHRHCAFHCCCRHAVHPCCCCWVAVAPSIPIALAALPSHCSSPLPSSCYCAVVSPLLPLPLLLTLLLPLPTLLLPHQMLPLPPPPLPPSLRLCPSNLSSIPSLGCCALTLFVICHPCRHCHCPRCHCHCCHHPCCCQRHAIIVLVTLSLLPEAMQDHALCMTCLFLGRKISKFHASGRIMFVYLLRNPTSCLKHHQLAQRSLAC